jgi:hypothetical protein
LVIKRPGRNVFSPSADEGRGLTDSVAAAKSDDPHSGSR